MKGISPGDPARPRTGQHQADRPRLTPGGFEPRTWVMTKPEGICTNALCGRAAAAKGFCSRHYQQDRRGVLNKTKTYAPDGESAEVKVATPRALKAKLVKAARRAGVSLSEYCRMILAQSMNAAE